MADLHPKTREFTTLEHFYRAQQNLSSQNRVETSWKKFARFFNMRVLDLDFYVWNSLVL
jgi:hypothetical protein